VLSYRIKYTLEANYDFVNVYASTNGIQWSTLAQYTGTSSDWQDIVIDLSTYAGNNLYIKFRITSDTSQTADGVYIDNVKVSGLPTQTTVYGDVDGNWLINLQDMRYVLDYSVGNNPIPDIAPYPWEAFRIAAADVDDDNQITALDSYYIFCLYDTYISSFPAQNGTILSFQNPLLSFSNDNTTLAMSFNEPSELKAMTVNLTSEDVLTISDINWNVSEDIVTRAQSSDNKTISLITTDNLTNQTILAYISYSLDGSMINCSGVVNDIPVNLDINVTSNCDDNSVCYPNMLLGNYPNPFAVNTNIRFSLAQSKSNVSIKLYNSKGQLVRTILDKPMLKGLHSIAFDGKDDFNKPLSSGVYIYKLHTESYKYTKRMVVLK
ncbi:MAG: T9SS type A sorting domain-containing protein, partial [Candidatus Cloacimonetes bacterium]|nr:T9SS type A sorting domain-containing protein [Candidatus Cloacimonadota bacterium]